MSEIIKFYEDGFDESCITIQWNLGNTCNYSCEYCPNILHNGTRPWVELPLIEDTILTIQNYFPDKKLQLEFLGGEITLYKDFIDLMKFCKNNNFSNLIFTNASRTFRHWKEVAPFLDKVLLTFHPHTTDEDHFKNIIELLHCSKVEYHVHIAMVDSLFEQEFKYAMEILQSYPEAFVSLTAMLDKEHKFNHDGYYYNYTEEQKDLMKQYSQPAEKYVAEYKTGEVKYYNLQEVQSLKLNQFKDFICGIKKSLIVIDALGNASTSLCRHKHSINIFSDEIGTLFGEHVCRKDACTNASDIRIFKILPCG